jgi:predicted deacylase
MNYQPKSLDALASIWGFTTEPGSVSYGRRTVTRRSSGEDLWVTAHLAVGSRPGPILGILSGSHGDEVYGVDMVRRLLERLRGLDFAGAAMCLPMANALAYESGTRTTGQGLNTDNNNLNRVFPGDRDGALNNQLAAEITDTFIAQVSVLLDVHTGGQDTLVDYVLLERDPSPIGMASRELSLAFGSDYVFESDGPAYAGTASGTARTLGVPALVPEVGGTVILDEDYLQGCLDRIQSVMAAMGMCAPAVVREDPQVMLTRRVLIRAHAGGYFLPAVGADALGTVLPRDTLLGEIYDTQTFEVLERVLAPYDGSVVFLLRAVQGRITCGDFLYMVGDLGSQVPITGVD